MNGIKNQGQSTTEYLLMTLVASIFVFTLTLEFSPQFSKFMGELENRVAEKISGGKLLSHPQSISGVTVVQQGTKQEGGVLGEEGGAGSGGIEETDGTTTGTFQGGGEVTSDLDSGEEGETSKVSATGGKKGALSPIGEEVSEGESFRKTEATQAQDKKEQAKETKKEEKEDSSRSKGIIYQEGQEIEALEGKRINWFQIFLIILIVIIIIYILFEIYKAIQLQRFGKK